MAPSPPRFTPPFEGFITAQEVRNIRAQLRRMSQPQGMDPQKVSEEQHRRRVDTEHRGVTGTPLADPFSYTGTLILTDVLDDKVECDWI
jgi:hypothetical protein